MLSPEQVRQGQHVMAVCNACRYCEGYCPVFPAMENRLAFAKGDLAYLANLCHNCGECLYACQYAPPHEFGIDVPRQLAEIRLGSYEEYCWPASLGAAFRRHTLKTAWAMAGGSSAVLLALAVMMGADIWPADPAGDFYACHSARRDGRAVWPRRRVRGAGAGDRLPARGARVSCPSSAGSFRPGAESGRKPGRRARASAAFATPSRCDICTAPAPTARTPKSSGLRGGGDSIT